MITDGNPHPLEWFDEHMSEAFVPIAVDEENFGREKSAGLWENMLAYNVQDGDGKITYRYYTPEGTLIKAETIPVVYNGENAVVFDTDDESEWAAGSYIGELGFRNGHFYVWNGSEWVLQTTATVDDIPPVPKYLGCYTKPPETANEDDWYLNSTNGITYKFDGAEWNAVADYDDSANTQMFMAEMSDLCALAKNTGETLFLERLCANVAFIGKLFSKNIILQSGGTIQSQNYRERTSGFKIGSDGVAEFNEGHFYGTITSASGFFGGSIASGPLYVDEVNPTNKQSEFVAHIGDSAQKFWEQIKDIPKSTALNGTIKWQGNTYPFSHVGYHFGYFGMSIEVEFFDAKLRHLPRFGSSYMYDYGWIKIGDVVKGTYEFRSYAKLECEIVMNKYSPNGKTLKLIDLPTSAASQSGYVYRDSEGYLRIS